MNGNMRLGNEFHSLMTNPIPGIVVKMQTLNQWHFVMRGPKDTAFYNGRYHGIINFPDSYPQSEPKISFTTANGRYIPYQDLCLYGHDWIPSYTIRNVLTSLRFHMASGIILGEGIIISPDLSKIGELATRSLAEECSLCKKLSEIEFPVEEDEKVKDPPLSVEKIELKENKEESKAVPETNQQQNQNVEEQERMGEWWYIFRLTLIEEIRIEIEQIYNSRSIYNVTRIKLLLGLYLYLYSIKIIFHPIVSLFFRILSILFFVGCVILMGFMIAKREKDNIIVVCIFDFIAIGGLIGNRVFFAARLLYVNMILIPIIVRILELVWNVLHLACFISISVYSTREDKLLMYVVYYYFCCLATQLNVYFQIAFRMVVFFLSLIPLLIEHIYYLTCGKRWKGFPVKSLGTNVSPNQNKCAICLGELDGTKGQVELGCHPSHVFHKECLKESVKVRMNCPCCKELIDVSTIPE